MDEQRDVVVVGGGLAGLAAAATAAAGGRSVLLLDAHPAGNRAGTDQVGRFRLNRGAHALYRTGAGRAVLRRLAVPVQGKRPPLTGALGRRGDVVDRLPLGPVSMVRSRLVPARGLARVGRVLAGMPFWRPEQLADRTAAAWFDELGLDGAAREMVEMLARTATYAADLDRVSADLVAMQMRMALMGSVLYLHGGWSSLVDGVAVAGERQGVERRVAPARSVEPDGGRVRVTVGREGDEQVILAGAVVVAAGTPGACAALLPARPPAWARLGPPVRVSCLDLGLSAVPEVKTLLGLDRPLYLIRHSPPARLAPTGGAVVHTMRYLHADEEAAPGGWRAELEEHCRLAGIDPDAAEQVRYLHRMVACGALPTPEGGGLAGRTGVSDTGLDGVFVAGDWIGPDGHLGDAALATGETAGRRAADHAAGGGPSRPRGATMATHG
jgi:glycine/D-amino acid oxidase-like deaminating enzyme